MRILRWRLKLAKYDYDIVYKASKTNVDTLSRNLFNIEESICKVINNRLRNPNDSKDTEAISKMIGRIRRHHYDCTI